MPALRLLAPAVCALLWAGAQGSSAQGLAPGVASLGLPAGQSAALTRALDAHDLVGAEKLLLPAANSSAHPAPLLAFLGAVYFQDRDFWNAVIAWNKADALAPLAPQLRFSLAMAYVQLGQRAWASKALLRLQAEQPNAPLFPYWLGRLAYDEQHYAPAIAFFQRALALDPHLSKAHNNLGLCLFALNQTEQAIQQYHLAIAGDTHAPHPSPWPYVNLSEALLFTGQVHAAADAAQQATVLDPTLPQAYFALGLALENEGALREAAAALEKAAALDVHYPGPHMALTRVYRRLGDKARSAAETQLYQQLKRAPEAAPKAGEAPEALEASGR